MRTIGQRLYKMEPPAGFSAQLTAGAVIDVATRLGYPLSTTHVISGGGARLGLDAAASARCAGASPGTSSAPGSSTLPAAAIVAAALYWPVQAIF